MDLRLKPPKVRTIPEGSDILFEDPQVGLIYTDRDLFNSDVLVIKVHFAAGSRYRAQPFAEILLHTNEGNDKRYLRVYAGKRNVRNYLGGYEVSFDDDEDLKDTFDKVLSDIYKGMELADKDSFVDTVTKSARKAIKKYRMSKMTV